MAQRPIRNKIEPISWASFVTKTRQIPKSVYRDLNCLLKLNMTFSSCTTFGIDDLIALIKNIDLTVNGSNTIFKNSLSYWYISNYLKNQGILAYSIDKTNGTRDVYFQFEIPFYLETGFKSEDTLLDIRDANTTVLKIDFGGNPPTGAIVNSGNVFINTDEYIFTDAAALDEYSTKEVNTIMQPLLKTGKTRLDLPTGFDVNYFRIIIETFDSTGARSNNELNEIELSSGAMTYLQVEADRLRQDNLVKYAIAAIPTGVHVIDLVREGRMMQSLGTQGLSELTLFLDVKTAGGQANIYLEKIGRSISQKLGIIKPTVEAKAK